MLSKTLPPRRGPSGACSPWCAAAEVRQETAVCFHRCMFSCCLVVCAPPSHQTCFIVMQTAPCSVVAMRHARRIYLCTLGHIRVKNAPQSLNKAGGANARPAGTRLGQHCLACSAPTLQRRVMVDTRAAADSAAGSTLAALAVDNRWADLVVVKLADGVALLEHDLGEHRAAHPGRIPGARASGSAPGRRQHRRLLTSTQHAQAPCACHMQHHPKAPCSRMWGLFTPAGQPSRLSQPSRSALHTLMIT